MNSTFDRLKYIKVDVHTVDVLIYFICFFFFIRPDYMSGIDIIAKTWGFLEAISVAFVLYFVYRYREFKNLGLWLLIGVYFWLWISTMLNGGTFESYYDDIRRCLIAMFVTYYGMKYDEERFLKVALMIVVFYTLANLGVMIIHPSGIRMGNAAGVNGIGEKFFLFGKNTAIKTTGLGVFLMAYYQLRYEGGIGLKSIILSGVVLVESLISGSGTSTIVSIILLAFLFLGVDRMPAFFNAVSGWILNIAFFFVIIVFQALSRFEYFIVDVMHKDMSFTGRMPLWLGGLLLISGSPIIGYGSEPRTVAAAKLGVNNDSMHNFIIDYMYQGGLVMIVLWTIFILYLAIVIAKMKDVLIKRLFGLFSFAMMIVWISEPFSRGRMVTMIILFSLMFTAAGVNVPSSVTKEKKIKLYRGKKKF